MIYSCVKLIVLKSLLLSIIEGSTFRDFSKYSERLSVKTLKEKIFKLVQLVEETITSETKLQKDHLCSGDDQNTLFTIFVSLRYI